MPNSIPSLQLINAHGAGITPYLERIAALRIAVFREWPYLYDGDRAYEANYLQTYARAAHSIVVLACDNQRIVGASTGLPMTEEEEAFQSPLQEAGIDPAQVFYCGESVLLTQYRGRGIGHAFFDAREAHARALGGFAWTAFAAVERNQNDPRQPNGHRDNEAFWRKRGYAPHPSMRLHLSWKELDGGDIDHTLTYWLRPLEAA